MIEKNGHKFKYAALGVLIPALLAGCLGGSSSNSSGPSRPPASSAASFAVSGVAVAGVINGATVALYDVASDGTRGAQLGAGTTAADGTFAITPGGVPGGAAVEVVISGGSYISESDGATVTNSATLSSLMPLSAADSRIDGVAVTPLSDMVASRARGIVAAGGGALADALAQANSVVMQAYGLKTAPGLTLPKFDKASIGSDGFTLGLILGTLDTCGKRLSAADASALAGALSADWFDGVLDGRKSGAPITLGSGRLSSTAATIDFLSCLSDYAANGKSLVDAGIAAADLTTTVSAVRAAMAGSPAVPEGVGLAAGSSGAMAAMAFSGKQWLFIAARGSGVVAVDISDPTAVAPAVKRFDMSTAEAGFGSTEIAGVVALHGGDHPQLLVFGYGSKHIALINADSGAVDYAADLAIAATDVVYFSGGHPFFITGGIPDAGRDGVWLGTADGYLFFDRASKALGASYAISLPYTLAENFGGDIGHNLLFAPNYASSGGVQVIDLSLQKSYYMDPSKYTSEFGALYEPDGGAVDSGYQVGIITNEDSPDVGFLNLATIIRKDKSSGYSTFFPASVSGAVHLQLGSANSPNISGSAVDSDTHLALFMAGYTSDIAVGQLQDPQSVAAGESWKGLSDWRYYTLPGYVHAGDPHAVAVVKNLADGKAYGYLLDGSASNALQIDMAGFLALAADGGDGHGVVTAPAAGIIKSISFNP